MGPKLIVTIAALCFAVIIAGSLIIADSIFQIIENIIASQTPMEPPYRTTTRDVAVFNEDGVPNPNPAKPYIISTGLTAKDDRTSAPYKLHISGRVNNTGSGTAYNTFLHILAMNSEGIAMDRNYSFGGITSHMNVGLNFQFTYIGSEIDNCTITPIYTDALPPQPFNRTAS